MRDRFTPFDIRGNILDFLSKSKVSYKVFFYKDFICLRYESSALGFFRAFIILHIYSGFKVQI